jgi:pimeloyl-ACP methyl ester carboxylesterase
MSRRIVVLVTVAAVALTVVGDVGVSEAAAASDSLHWTPCRGGFECARLVVPVDYSTPNGATVGIAVTRRPAGDSSRRIGALFVNFGGPGVPSGDTLRQAAPGLPKFLRDRFDLVSFDPRGTGDSRVIDCVSDSTFRRYLADDPTPSGVADLPPFYDGSASSVDLVGGCIQRQGSWLAHVGTRDVARDVDRFRAALGERTIGYLGFSYGTVLGAVYAQEFPHHIRTMVLDSAVNLSDNPVSELEQNTEGFEHALDSFLDDCTINPDCALTAGANPRSELLHLRDEFERGETVATTDGRSIGVSEFYVSLIAAMYTPQLWPVLARALQGAAQGNGTRLEQLTDSYVGIRPDGKYNNQLEAIGIILCDDRPDSKVSFAEFRSTFEALRLNYPFFGPLFAGAPLGCDPRLPAPSPSEILGDVRAEDAPPILVVGVTNDPATPYTGAEDLVTRLRGSRLLSLEGTRHGGFAQGSACVDAAVERYLVTKKLPTPDTLCPS